MKSAKRLNRKLVKSRLTKKKRQVGRGINNFLVTYKKGDRVVNVEGSVNGNNIAYTRISRSDPKVKTTKVIKNMDAYLKRLNELLGGDDTDGSKTLFIMRDGNDKLVYKILTVTVKNENVNLPLDGPSKRRPNFTLKGPFAFNDVLTKIDLGPMDEYARFDINYVDTVHDDSSNDAPRIQFFGNNNNKPVSSADKSKFSRSAASRIALRKGPSKRKNIVYATLNLPAASSSSAPFKRGNTVIYSQIK